MVRSNNVRSARGKRNWSGARATSSSVSATEAGFRALSSWRFGAQATSSHMRDSVACSVLPALLALFACAFHVPAPSAGAMAPLALVSQPADGDRPYVLVDGRLWF